VQVTVPPPADLLPPAVADLLPPLPAVPDTPVTSPGDDVEVCVDLLGLPCQSVPGG
jgi:hypothetical protein